jgi:hypothetical protein
MSLTKLIPIESFINLKVQGVFLNAFNHVSWFGMDTGVQDGTFGSTSGTSGARQIEIRANLQF